MNPTLDARAKDGPIRNQLAGAVAQSFAVPDPAYAIAAGAQGKGGVFGSGRDSQDTFVVQQPYTVANCLTRRMHKGINSTLDEGQTPVLVFDTTQVTSPANYSNPQPGDPCHPLAAGAHVPAVAYTTKLHNTASNQSGKFYEEYATSLDRSSPPPAGLFAPTPTAVAFDVKRGLAPHGAARESDTAFPLAASDHKDPQLVRSAIGGEGGRHDGMMQPNMQVRRLTPTECERLQGFPDGYTDIPWGKKPAGQCPDGPRYKALGNSWAVPVVRWIGQRISHACAHNLVTPHA